MQVDLGGTANLQASLSLLRATAFDALGNRPRAKDWYVLPAFCIGPLHLLVLHDMYRRHIAHPHTSPWRPTCDVSSSGSMDLMQEKTWPRLALSAATSWLCCRTHTAMRLISHYLRCAVLHNDSVVVVLWM